MRIGIWACCVVGLAGCGRAEVTLTGKLVPPATVKIYESDSISVRFFPDVNDPKAQAYFADVNPSNMTFSTKLPPGNYKVGVEINGYPGEKTTTQKRIDQLAELNRAFAREQTPLRYEVTSDASQSVTVEMMQGRVIRN